MCGIRFVWCRRYADQRKYEAAAATEDAATEPERLIETMCRTVWGAAVEVFPFLEECRCAGPPGSPSKGAWPRHV